jgi:hypothetical protein
LSVEEKMKLLVRGSTSQCCSASGLKTFMRSRVPGFLLGLSNIKSSEVDCSLPIGCFGLFRRAEGVQMKTKLENGSGVVFIVIVVFGCVMSIHVFSFFFYIL